MKVGGSYSFDRRAALIQIVEDLRVSREVVRSRDQQFSLPLRDTAADGSAELGGSIGSLLGIGVLGTRAVDVSFIFGVGVTFWKKPRMLCCLPRADCDEGVPFAGRLGVAMLIR
jgi:hypothetical protein